MRNLFLILIFFAFSTLTTFAADIAVGEQKTYAVVPHLSYYNDVSGTMDMEAVKEKDFSPLPVTLYAFPISSDAHWLTFTLENNSSQTKSYYLEYDQSYVNEIDFYLFKEGQEVSAYQTGALRPKSTRAVDYHLYLFPIALDAGEEAEIYVRLQHISTAVPLSFKLQEEKTYFTDHYSEILLQGLFFGMMIVMFFYNMILYIMTGYKDYLAYIFYLATITLFLSISHGFGLYFFEITSEPLYRLILYSVSMLYTVFIIWFMMEVLELKLVLPKAFTFLKGLNYIFLLSWVAVSMLVLLGLLQYVPILMKIFMPTFLVMNIFILLMLLFLSLKKHRVATLILLPWLLVIVSLILMILTILSVIPPYDWAKSALQGAIVFEAVMFSVVLGERYRQQDNRLIQQSKQAEMGAMIENIAHQWRQPLSGINADVFSAEACLENNNLRDAQKLLTNIEEKTLMMSNIINDFQNFYDPNKARQLFKLEDILHHAYDYNKERFDNNHIDCSLALQKGVRIYGNENEYFQVVLAILNNAIRALNLSNGSHREIKLATSIEKEYAVLTIQNSGEKILPEDLPYLFEPRFTTKENKRGSGIGLFMSKKIIVESFDGIIDIQNDDDGVCVMIKVKYV